MTRIGWRAVAVDTYIMANGTVLKLSVDCDPRMLLALAMVGLEVAVAVQSDLFEALASMDKADGFHRAKSSASGWWEEYHHVQ